MGYESLGKFIRFLVCAAILCGLLYVLIPMDLPSLQADILKVMLKQLTVLIVIALFLERSLEVYKHFYFSPEKERLETQVDHCQLKLQRLISAGESSSHSSVQTAQLPLLQAEEELRLHRNYTRQSLLWAAIVFGLLISLVGVRSLEAAFAFPEPEVASEVFRFYLFRVLDLVLTAGLIAGGSEGIHNVIKKLSNLFPDVPQKIADFIHALNQDPA